MLRMDAEFSVPYIFISKKSAFSAMEMKKSEIFWKKYSPRVGIARHKTFGSSPKVTVLHEGDRDARR